jgi:hypothetical protein
MFKGVKITNYEKLREGDDINKAGVKFDEGKARYDLLPPEGVFAVSDILGVGARSIRPETGNKGWIGPDLSELPNVIFGLGGLVKTLTKIQDDLTSGTPPVTSSSLSPTKQEEREPTTARFDKETFDTYDVGC